MERSEVAFPVEPGPALLYHPGFAILILDQDPCRSDGRRRILTPVLAWADGVSVARSLDRFLWEDPTSSHTPTSWTGTPATNITNPAHLWSTSGGMFQRQMTSR